MKLRRGRGRGQAPDTGLSVLQLFGEALHLLRKAPAAVLLVYFAGTVPFILGLLFFWTDMSQNAFALERCAPEAFALATLFVIMKTAQTDFARRIWECRAGSAASPVGRASWFRTLAVQTALHATGLIVVPLALLAMVPFAWTYAFYQNSTALGREDAEGVRALSRTAWQQALLDPLQNHYVIAVGTLIAFVLFLNLFYALAWGPHLLRMLLGIETVFTFSGFHLLNTTFLMSVAALTFLCIDPLIKTVYVLRVFYGKSLRTGEDLLADLEGCPRSAPGAARRAMALAMLAAVLAGGAADADAVEPGAQRAALPLSEVSPAELNREIEKTVRDPRYAWKMPRDESPEGADKNFLVAAAEWLADYTGEILEGIGSLLSKIEDWLEKIIPDWQPRGRSGGGSGGGWSWKVWFIVAGLALVLLGLGLWFFLARRRRKKAVETAAEVQPAVAAPDLEQEDVSPDELPEDEWFHLAQEMLGKGEYRLGARALFLGMLAGLARRELISVARFKSDLDYQRELHRRAHVLPALVGAFDMSVAEFERVWYGDHPATEETIGTLNQHIGTLRGSERDGQDEF